MSFFLFLNNFNREGYPYLASIFDTYLAMFDIFFDILKAQPLKNIPILTILPKYSLHPNSKSLNMEIVQFKVWNYNKL